jgi:uncharacterized protein with HEPN domain
MPRDIRKICFDILKAVTELQDFTDDKEFVDYGKSRMLQMAVERGFEIIGEALRRMREEFPENFAAVSDGRNCLERDRKITWLY